MSALEWFTDAVDELELADDRGTLVLIDKADDARLPELLHELERRSLRPALCTRADELYEVAPGSVVLLQPEPEEFSRLNMARPVLRERRLRVLLWSDAERTQKLSQQASDVYDWVSRYIECPRGVPLHALVRLQDWIARGEWYVGLQGERWREVLDATGEPWCEVPREVLREYATAVAFLRANPGKRLVAKDFEFDHRAATRLVVAALTENAPLPVVFTGEHGLLWFRQAQTESVSVSMLQSAIERLPASSPWSASVALGPDLLSFALEHDEGPAAPSEPSQQPGNEGPPGGAVPCASRNQPASLAALHRLYDQRHENDRPIGMDPSVRLERATSSLGSGRSERQIPASQYSDWSFEVVADDLDDILEHWVAEGLAFVRNNPLLIEWTFTLVGAPLHAGLATETQLDLPSEAIPRDASEHCAVRVAEAVVQLCRVLQDGTYQLARAHLTAAPPAPHDCLLETDLPRLSRWISAHEPPDHSFCRHLESSEATLYFRAPELLRVAIHRSFDLGHPTPRARSLLWLPYWPTDEYTQALALLYERRYALAEPSEASKLLTGEGHHATKLDAIAPHSSSRERRGYLSALSLRLLHGEALTELGAFDLALESLTRAQTEMTRWLGPTHPQTQLAINSTGRLYALLGATARALPLLRDSWAALAERIGPRHPDTLRARLELARLPDASLPDVARAREGLVDDLAVMFGEASPLTRCARRLLSAPPRSS